MPKEFVASNGFSIRQSGEGILIDNVYLGPPHIDALDEFWTFLDTQPEWQFPE